MAKINFRSAEITDLPILYEFEQGIISAERPFDPTLKNDPISYYDLKALVEAKNTEVIVALIDDTIIGAAYVKINEAKDYLKFDKYAYLGFMYVKPEFRGQGISQQIIDKLRNWAKSKNLNELRLDVYNDNHKAVFAYEKFGFKQHLVEMRMKI